MRHWNHPRPASRCIALAVLVSVSNSLTAGDWPQWLGPQRDGNWRETGIVRSFPEQPDYRWRTPIAAGYSGPAVADGRVFVMDRQLSAGASNPEDPFSQGMIPGNERILCLDEATGEILWIHEYDCPYSISYAAGPRTTPAVDGDRVYTVGAEGNLKCLNTLDGSVIWEKDFNDDFEVRTPTWGFASHPLIDGDRLICIVGDEQGMAAAFDKHTGEVLWQSIPGNHPGYAPPMIYELNGERQLIVWTADGVHGLKPGTGEVLWDHPWKQRYDLAVPTPRKIGDDQLFFTAFYNGSLMLKVFGDEPEVLWQSRKISEKDTDKLNSIISTPVIEGNTIYGVCSYGQFRALDLATGERLWESMKPTTGEREQRWGNAFIVRNGGEYFLFNEQGELILADLTREGYRELDRMKILEATNRDARTRNVVWSHPAFANGHIIARNDQEIVSIDLKNP